MSICLLHCYLNLICVGVFFSSQNLKSNLHVSSVFNKKNYITIWIILKCHRAHSVGVAFHVAFHVTFDAKRSKPKMIGLQGKCHNIVYRQRV